MDHLPSLNLPPYAPRLRQGLRHSEIFDSLRGRFVALTPEEWVRQCFVNHLIVTLGYPRGLMANEVGIKLNDTQRRCDTVVYSRTGMRPLMVVECKAPHVAITQKVFDQIARYNVVVGARWLVVTNGLSHYCCEFTPEGTYRFLREIPRYEMLVRS